MLDKRLIYEKFNIYIYVIIPIFICLLYVYAFYNGILNLSHFEKYNANKFNFILTILSVLLTIYGFMISLPENNVRKLLRRYKHDEIISRTILIGILSSFLFTALYMFDISCFFQDIIFLVTATEVVIATIKIYGILTVFSKDIH